MLNRAVAPDFQKIQTVRFPAVEHRHLDNQIPLHIINVGEQSVFRLEVIFEAGTWHETVEGSSFFMMKMLSEGTQRRTSAEISEHFDGLGAFLELGQAADRSNVVVYGLPKHLESILEVVQEMLTTATFPESELENLKNITSQNLRINFEKSAYVAAVHFRERLFGAHHPYGRSQSEEKVRSVNRDIIRALYDQRLLNRPFSVFLSGKISETEANLVNHYLGQHSPQTIDLEGLIHPIEPQTSSFRLDRPDAMQSSVRVGRRLFTRSHPDYFPFILCNEVLGGYFGSRLMQNIREDKGYTYGISSSFAPLRHAGSVTISADVKKEFAQATLDEIRKEIEILQNDLVPTHELETVKNFMAGELAGSLNTPFEVADRARLIVLDGLAPDFYERFIERLRAVSAEQVREMAQRYFKWEDLQQVVVG